VVSKEMREGVEVEVDRREPLAAVAGQRRRLSTSAAMLPSFRSHLAPRSPRPARAVRSAVRALSRPRARRKRKRALHAARCRSSEEKICYRISRESGKF